MEILKLLQNQSFSHEVNYLKKLYYIHEKEKKTQL